MTKKELYHILHANGVPALLYKDWDFREVENPFLQKTIPSFVDNIDDFIMKHKCLYFFLNKDYVLASRIAVAFLIKAYINNWLLSRYIVPTTIVGYKVESWDNGNAYDELLDCDFLVIDKMSIRQFNGEAQKQKMFDEFVEDRLLKEKSTIFVGSSCSADMFSTRILHILKNLEAQEIQLKQVFPVC